MEPVGSVWGRFLVAPMALGEVGTFDRGKQGRSMAGDGRLTFGRFFFFLSWISCILNVLHSNWGREKKRFPERESYGQDRRT